MMNALDQMHSRNAYVIIITDCEEEIEEQHKREVEKIEKENLKLPEEERKAIPDRKYHFILSIPHVPHISHLLAIVPIQLLVEKLCPLRGEKGIDPDHPRNLAKSVTV
jgi:glucosamine 6-phosphate synthetase-like amidotransferase/phosphosugar isomerase protein